MAAPKTTFKMVERFFLNVCKRHNLPVAGPHSPGYALDYCASYGGVQLVWMEELYKGGISPRMDRVPLSGMLSALRMLDRVLDDQQDWRFNGKVHRD